MKITRRVATALVAAVVVTIAACATTQAPAPSAPAPRAFDAGLVQRGAVLSAIGNCRGCHTTAEGKSFAGGVPFRTAFGTIYSSNITPDAKTGIGDWSEADFHRAMRLGVAAEGYQLYPVFPYDHFTHVTDDDIRAIYAYLMTRPAVSARTHKNELVFPFNLRETVKLWKSRYFHPGPRAFATRGEYLVEGLGHCGSCHTPRNAEGAERHEQAFNGGEAEGWHAYAINERTQAPIAWTVDSMTAYLKHGYHAEHGVSRGPMALVTEELADVPEAELREIARHVVSLMARAEKPAPPPSDVALGNGGGALYAATCAGCHDGSQPLPFGGVTLPISMGVAGESPLNLFNVMLYGLPPANGSTAPIMPGFEGALSDAQMLELARWMRARFTRKGPWPDLEASLRKARQHGAEGARFAAGGSGLDPAAATENR